MSGLPNAVLVHGAWADGSSWSAVIGRLQDDGHKRHRVSLTEQQQMIGRVRDTGAPLAEPPKRHPELP